MDYKKINRDATTISLILYKRNVEESTDELVLAVKKWAWPRRFEKCYKISSAKLLPDVNMASELENKGM